MADNKINYQGKIGLALGAGSARGWSHIGVIKALRNLGIEPDIVCGTSIGALVGASYCAKNLKALEGWLLKLTKLDVARFFDFNWTFNGFIDSVRMKEFLEEYVADSDQTIENLDKTFATVSTELTTGREIWFTKGSVNDAVWASMSLPGLFPPVQNESRWLVDGGLVNPVPVSVCRAQGADFVIAVSLTGNLTGKHFKKTTSDLDRKDQSNESANFADRVVNTIKEYSSSIFPDNKNKDEVPGLYDAIAGSIHITQERITRSRMAGDPPDLLLTPKVGDIGLMEFYRASSAMAEGEACVNRLESELRYQLGID